MRNVLQKSFFNRPVLSVTEDLLGKFLVRRIDGKGIALMITEVEAYDGLHDKACHASKGRTARTEIMFGPAGHFYVYLVYGMYWMLNIVTDYAGYPSAVLIRGAGVYDGPGKLTKHLCVDKHINKKVVDVETGLWVEDRGVIVAKKQIKRTPRIGVSYAGPIWSQKLYRFYLE